MTAIPDNSLGLATMKIRVLFILLCGLLSVSFSPAMAQDDVETCLTCHEDEELTGIDLKGAEISVFVSPEHYSSSVHGDLECIDCHEDLSGFDDYPHHEELQPVDCGLCHEDAAEIYQWHGRVKISDGAEGVPTCADCHGRHDILPLTDSDSRVNVRNVPETCNRCHEDQDMIEQHELLYSKQVLTAFKTSVHGQASGGGVSLAATCNDCHSTSGTAHRILGPGHQESSINHFNIPETCGKCHPGAQDDFQAGIHGKLVTQGETDPPVCTNCHGEHGILSPSDPRSLVSHTRVAEATCSPCHESARLNEKYGLPTGRLKSWVDSYHGLKSKAGDVAVANCASCHGAHKILPSSDPESPVHTKNLQATCGDCHPNISEKLAQTPVHGTPGISTTPIAGVVADIYIAAIVVIIGAMVVHWMADLRKQIHLIMLRRQIRRMTRNETAQHWFLMISFIVLVITGFSLRFSDAFWVEWFFGWDGGFPMRGILHRVAVVVFSLSTLWHLIFLASRRGRDFLRDMFPRFSDFRHFWQMMRYNLGSEHKRPRAGRFSYVEKAEYWALVWGSAVMIVTGFLLWFDNVAVEFFPKGFLDIMLVVHYYEAWLAALAILVWHLYSTVFSPAVYPMNPAWINGKMPLDFYQHEHPDDPALAEYLSSEVSNDDIVPTDGDVSEAGSSKPESAKSGNDSLVDDEPKDVDSGSTD